MKKIITLIIFAVGLTSCGNSHLFDPEDKVNTGSSLSGTPTTTGILPPFTGGGGGSLDVLLCHHPDAVNFDSSMWTSPGACTFTACDDESFVEHDLRVEYQKYIDKHGGSILDDPGKCKDKKQGEGYCDDALASNTGAYETCIYKGCGLEGYYEYQIYQDLITLHGDKVQRDDSLCLTPILYPGCTSLLAENMNPESDVDDGTCVFKACTDENFQEYNVDIITAIASYASEHGLNFDEINSSEGQCLTPIAVSGCMIEGSLTYNEHATIEDGTCKWSACLLEQYQEYDGAMEILIQNYAQVHSVSNVNDLVVSTCQNLRPKCEDSRAENEGKYELCHYHLCADPLYEEYPLYLEIKALADAGQATMQTSPSYCINLIKKEGCLEESAENTTIGANHENGTCLWKACLDEKYEEYNALTASIIQSYANQHGGGVSSYYENTCKTLKAKVGCTDPKADNYDSSAEVDNKTCKFKVCTDCKYVEFGANGSGTAYQKTLAASAYANLHGLSFTSVIVDNCKTPIGTHGCTDPYAKNYKGNAWSDNKTCVYKACLSGANYGGGSSNFMTPFINAYALEHSLNIVETTQNVSNSSNGKVYVVKTCHAGARKLVINLDSECLNSPYNSAYIKVQRAGLPTVSRPLTTPQNTAVYDVTNGQSYSVEIINGGVSVYHFSGTQSVSGSISGDTIHEISCK